MGYILAIDPSNKHSAWCLIRLEDLFPIEFGFAEEKEMKEIIREYQSKENYLAVENMECMGLAVGRSVLDTCILIGRFLECADSVEYADIQLILRHDEKMTLCGSVRGVKDANIIQALIDRFAPDAPNKGKGNKASPAWFYGFRADIWQAYAVGITYYEMYLKNKVV